MKLYPEVEPLSLEKLNRPESLSEMAGRELRDAIIEGRLKLGDQLSEIRLSKMLGISKTPVREALMQLRREGLVQIDPQRGTSIFRIEDREIDQIAGFRRLLETEAARLIFLSDKAPVLRHMAKILEAMDRAIAREAFQTYRRLDADFHMALIEGAGNSYLVSAYGLIAAKIGALRSRAHDDTQVVDRSLETHRRLYRLLEAGEERKFNELLGVHIANTGRDYRAWLARQTAAGDAAAAGLSSPTATASR
ncbi:GntR family transcriptional regulator [Mesorhizobium koreense]|uniref:GntR family transcriptional regulator n=1 Tax=Mesorhizobium koreense TaxID=3074855 RepID=UPI00287B63AC|nr:GntR family transcriptional regulator [Mesorhizobium sp. WR6]